MLHGQGNGICGRVTFGDRIDQQRPCGGAIAIGLERVNERAQPVRIDRVNIVVEVEHIRALGHRGSLIVRLRERSVPIVLDDPDWESMVLRQELEGPIGGGVVDDDGLETLVRRPVP